MPRTSRSVTRAGSFPLIARSISPRPSRSSGSMNGRPLRRCLLRFSLRARCARAAGILLRGPWATLATIFFCGWLRLSPAKSLTRHINGERRIRLAPFPEPHSAVIPVEQGWQARQSANYKWLTLRRGCRAGCRIASVSRFDWSNRLSFDPLLEGHRRLIGSYFMREVGNGVGGGKLLLRPIR